MKRMLLILLYITGSLACVPAMSQQQPPTPEQLAQNAAATRQAVFKLLGFNMGPIGAMARGRMPFDAAVVQKNSERIILLAGMITETFEQDTRGFELETRALDKIWDNQEDFARHAVGLIEAATAFHAISLGGDQAAIMQELRTLGNACSNCHDLYRLDVD